MSPTRIELHEDPSLEILDRITEVDVALWMAAKLHSIRLATKLPIYHIVLNAWRREYKDQPYDMDWSMHAPDVCVINHGKIESAVAEIREIILGDPKGKAAEKRRQAAALLQEAAQLESIA